MPTLLIDILRPIVASEPDMAVVGRVNEGDLLAAARRTRADVILVGQKATDDRTEREEFVQLLLQRPRLKVLAIADDGKTGALYELRPRRIPLGEMSAEALRNAIRNPGPDLIDR
jgi:DNA-binding NarL/FixJ family response regulator